MSRLRYGAQFLARNPTLAHTLGYVFRESPEAFSSHAPISIISGARCPRCQRTRLALYSLSRPCSVRLCPGLDAVLILDNEFLDGVGVFKYPKPLVGVVGQRVPPESED